MHCICIAISVYMKLRSIFKQVIVYQMNDIFEIKSHDMLNINAPYNE